MIVHRDHFIAARLGLPGERPAAIARPEKGAIGEPINLRHIRLGLAGDYQENIPAPGDFDIFLCLLWSRLGTRLGSKHRTQDGKTFESGTVYEFENALEAARGSASPEHPRGRPDMLIFVKKGCARLRN